MRREEEEGVITVFFSLIFLLVVSMIGSMLYAALTAGARSVGERVFALAGESVLAGYYRPLYEEYHIFAKAYPGAFGVYPHQLLEEELTEWSRQNLEDGAVNAGKNFLPAHVLEEISITEVTYLLSDCEDWFVSQAADYQKYRAAADAADYFMQLKEAIGGMSEAAEVLEAKTKAEEKYAEAAMETAELMRCIDGVKWKRRYFIFSGKGVSGAEQYAKQLWTGEITPQSTGINHQTVFKAVQGQYVRADRLAEEAYAAAEEAGQIAEQEAENEAELAEIRLRLYELEKESGAGEEVLESQNVPEAKAGSRENAAEREQKRLLTARKAELEQLQNELSSRRRKLERTTEKLISELREVSASSLESTYEALELIESISGRLEAAGLALKVFEEVLAEAGPYLEAEMMAQFQQDAALLRENGGIGYDVEAAGEELGRRQSVLGAVEEGLWEASKAFEASDYTGTLQALSECRSRIEELEWRGPAFDYSDYQEDTIDCDPLDALKELMNSGIAALVLPEGTEVSEKKMTKGALPSEWKLIMQEEEEEGDEGGSILGLDLSLDKLFSINFSCLAEAAAEKLLFISYAGEHFGNFLQAAKDNETGMNYEQEYLLTGKEEDEDNLNAMITKLVLMRALINLIGLTADAQAREEAELLAEAATAVTGIPILKIVFTSLLLLLWAAQLAFVEVSALLKGYQVPVIPDKEERPVEFADLFIMIPSVIRQKAEQYKAQEDGLLAGYQDYLRLLLLAADTGVLDGRGLDLVEVNIRKWYEEDFRILYCVCGFQAEMRASIPFRFPDFPITRLIYGEAGMEYRTEAEFLY
ncbi:MAG: hypothetical protein J6B85_03230 [Lachnospiraceae bacterium]|nr:hypothetical protein [Lachnospiraceae bacterium]